MAIHHHVIKPSFQLVYGMTPIPAWYDYIAEFHVNDLMRKIDTVVSLSCGDKPMNIVKTFPRF